MRIDLFHPGVTFGIAGLLMGATFSSIGRTIPRHPLPPLLPAAAPADQAGSSGGPEMMAPPPGTPAAAGRIQSSPPGTDLHALAPLPSYLPPPAAPLVGPPAPARGPVWKGAALPVISADELQAMQNPRAVRRARRLLRLGFVPPPEPGLSPKPPITAPARRPAAGGDSSKHPTHGATAAVAAGGATAKPLVTAILPAGPAIAPAREHSELPGQGFDPLASPAPSPAAKEKTASAGPVAASGSGSSRAKATGESAGQETAAAAGEAPIHLRAYLDRTKAEYQAGQWVAVRFLASRPVHLRVYRVDAAGHVTRVFSTYGRDDRGRPARDFSMMVKAGEPRPGEEGMVAIGSARPLTRDELVACLRAYLAEGPSDSAPPTAPLTSLSGKPGETAVAMPPLAGVLQTVIAAVGQTADTLDAPSAPLDRSAWSIAVGRFVSAERKLSAAPEPRAARTAAAGS